MIFVMVILRRKISPPDLTDVDPFASPILAETPAYRVPDRAHYQIEYEAKEGQPYHDRSDEGVARPCIASKPLDHKADQYGQGDDINQHEVDDRPCPNLSYAGLLDHSYLQPIGLVAIVPEKRAPAAP